MLASLNDASRTAALDLTHSASSRFHMSSYHGSNTSIEWILRRTESETDWTRPQLSSFLCRGHDVLPGLFLLFRRGPTLGYLGHSAPPPHPSPRCISTLLGPGVQSFQRLRWHSLVARPLVCHGVARVVSIESTFPVLPAYSRWFPGTSGTRSRGPTSDWRNPGKLEEKAGGSFDAFGKRGDPESNLP